jgi:hypothetical protein
LVEILGPIVEKCDILGSFHMERPLPIFLQIFPFYLPHMEYEGSIGFVSRNVLGFYVLGLKTKNLTKKHNLSDKNNSVCDAPLPV